MEISKAFDLDVTAERAAASFLPPENRINWNGGAVQVVQLSGMQKVVQCVEGVFLGLANLAHLAIVAALNLPAACYHWIRSSATEHKELPRQSAQDLANALPAKIGFADSLYQTVGLGTKASAKPFEGVSNWDKWLTPEHIEGGVQDYKGFFTDILSNPAPFIGMLKDMGSTAYRFSLEWAVIQPAPGVYDLEAVSVYNNFINQLIEAGIEPHLTLHHFVLPEWFEQIGGFERVENVDLYVQNSIAMMKLFPQVKNWMTFNEPGVYAFQSRMRGVYPPGLTGNVTAHGTVLRNLLIAHCKTYQAAQQEKAAGNIDADVKIGITHQWLKFVPHSGNVIERIVCFFLSKLTHYVVYDFFKTGRMSLDLPFVSNIQFEIPKEEFEANNRFLDFIGVQFYGFPQLKIGMNGGKAYPGTETQNFCLGSFGFSSGATCQEGGKVMSFGPGFFPESMDACLTEAIAIKDDVRITETGCDAKVQHFGSKEWVVDNAVQKEYFEKIPSILAKFKDYIKAIFVWTAVRNHDEWEHGNKGPVLGIIDLTKDENREITAYKLSPAAEFVQEAFLARNLAGTATQTA